jgi:chromosome segregation ATPase
MVIGPNGTGKSTILCAFCLGLGGEPPVLGRADDARLFIMHDQEEAIIEIELEPLKGGETHVFKRKIERSKGGRNGRGASTFYINNQKTTAKEVQELVTKTYHIAVKNLCQFLPQDRVGNFSGFTPQELLVETEKSMNGNGQLYETHQKLIDMEHELKNSGSEVETIESKLKRLVADNERLEREKERMEEREEAERQLKLLNFKYLWLQFDACREAAKELKGAKDAAKEALRVQNETLQPLEEAHSLLVTQKHRYDARAKTLETNLKKAVKEQEKQYEKAEKHQDELDTTLSSLVSIETASRKAAQDIERAKEQLAKMEAAMEDLPSMELCDEAQKEASAEYNRLRGPFENAKRELVRAHGAIKDKNEEKNQMVHKLARMNDEKTQRKQKVFAAFRELQEISDWIDHNKAQFRRPVWGPIACEVTTKSNNAAASLEHHVPNATLKSFVVECKEDYDLLYSKIRREKNLPINVLIVPNGKLQDIDRKYSANKMRILKEEHGISGYLDEAFTAPDAIIQALRNSAQVHNVLVGGTKTQAHIDSKGLLDFLGEPETEGQGLRGYCIFASKGQRSFRYTGTVSKYSKKLAMSQDELRGSRFLSPGVNPEHKKRLEDEIKSINAELLELERTHHELLSRKDDLEKQAQDAFARLRHAKETITEVTKKQKARERAQRKLRDLEKAAVSDSDDEKMKLVRAIQARMKASVTALEAHADQQRNIMKHTFSLAGVRINLDTSVAAIRRAE